MAGRDIISIGIKNKDINYKTINLGIISIFSKPGRLLFFFIARTEDRKASIINITNITGRDLLLIFFLYNTY